MEKRSGSLPFYLTVLLLTLATQILAAPPTHRVTLTALGAVDRYELSALDNEALLADSQTSAAMRPGALKFAERRLLDLDTESSGTWDRSGDGTRIWRVRILSPGALSINLAFSQFDLPLGAALWIYAAGGSEVLGPYTLLDRNQSGEFWSPIVLGEEVVVELQLPPGSGEASLTLAYAHHGFRTLGRDQAGAHGVPKQGSCQNDVICPEGDPWRAQIRSVAWYTLAGQGTCTGTLVNNTSQDGKPYFLTADHCGITPGNAGSMVVYWNYESPTCGRLSGGQRNQSQSGAIYRASYEPSDFALVELQRQPDPAVDSHYAGWNATGNRPSSAVGIHHPNLDEKSISFSHTPLQNDGNTHWEIVWNDGTTEPGSSGSCIFGPDGLCVGTLTGGWSYCWDPQAPDYYGKFSRSFTGGGSPSNSLRTWLDPNNTGRMTQNGIDASQAGGGGGGGGGGGSCTPGDTTLCLLNNRFKVTATWRDHQSQSGQGRRVPFGSDNTGILWFFNQDNWEIMLKVLDGCGLNQRYWVFAAGTTDVAYTLRVEDMQTGAVREYANSLGVRSPAFTDTSAFGGCP